MTSTMDPFQIRLECLQLIRRLTASQASINKVVDFAVRYATVAAEDIWDCMLTECSKSSLNARLNIVFLLDALLVSIVDPIGYSSTFFDTVEEKEASKATTSTSSTAASGYLAMANRDLSKIVEAVVPQDDASAVRLNIGSVQKILLSWKRLGIFDSAIMEEQVEALVNLRKSTAVRQVNETSSRLSKSDVLRRIEEDRERHKRLRERAWILPVKSFADCAPIRNVGSRKTQNVRPLATTKANQHDRTQSGTSGVPDALDVEFEDAWEGVSDLNEDDLEEIRESNSRWWGSNIGQRISTIQNSHVSKDVQQSDRSLKRETTEDPTQHSPAKRHKDESSGSQNGKSQPNRWKRIGRNEHGRDSWHDSAGNQADRRNHFSDNSQRSDGHLAHKTTKQ